MSTRPKVTACILTYNHANYIAQAVQSAVDQDVDFEYEVLVADDCSTDGTAAIVGDFARRFPDRVRLRPRAKNLGQWASIRDLMESARGEYVAYLEGDDYWTSNAKIATQARFLDKHSDFALCFHNVVELDEVTGAPAWAHVPHGQNPVSTLDDILVRNFVPSCSVLYRNGLTDLFPTWRARFEAGDWINSVLLAESGKLGYLDEVWAVHRTHRGSVWSARPVVRNMQQVLDVYRAFEEHLGPRSRSVIRGCIADQHMELAIALARAGDVSDARRNAARAFSVAPDRRWMSYRYLKSALWATAPRLMNGLRALRSSSRDGRASNTGPASLAD